MAGDTPRPAALREALDSLNMTTNKNRLPTLTLTGPVHTSSHSDRVGGSLQYTVTQCMSCLAGAPYLNLVKS